MTTQQDIVADGIFVSALRAKGTSCSSARRIVRNTKRGYGNGHAKIKGYRCRVAGNSWDGGYFRCSRGRTVLQFRYGV